MSISSKLELREGPGGRGLFVREPIAAGEPLLRFEGPLGDKPTRMSVQIGVGRHVYIAPDAPEQFVNHACEPNGGLEFPSFTLIALRPLAVGEEVTFNYLTSEWDMGAPFQCTCGAPRCFGMIRGYRWLSPEERRRITPQIAPFLREALDGLSQGA
jgi:hypothetical protein